MHRGLAAAAAHMGECLRPRVEAAGSSVLVGRTQLQMAVEKDKVVVRLEDWDCTYFGTSQLVVAVQHVDWLDSLDSCACHTQLVVLEQPAVAVAAEPVV